MREHYSELQSAFAISTVIIFLTLILSLIRQWGQNIQKEISSLKLPSLKMIPLQLGQLPTLNSFCFSAICVKFLREAFCNQPNVTPSGWQRRPLLQFLVSLRLIVL